MTEAEVVLHVAAEELVAEYRDDLNKGNELTSKGDKVALQNFCINQARQCICFISSK